MVALVALYDYVHTIRRGVLDGGEGMRGMGYVLWRMRLDGGKLSGRVWGWLGCQIW